MIIMYNNITHNGVTDNYIFMGIQRGYSHIIDNYVKQIPDIKLYNGVKSHHTISLETILKTNGK